MSNEFVPESADLILERQAALQSDQVQNNRRTLRAGATAGLLFAAETLTVIVTNVLNVGGLDAEIAEVGLGSGMIAAASTGLFFAVKAAKTASDIRLNAASMRSLTHSQLEESIEQRAEASGQMEEAKQQRVEAGERLREAEEHHREAKQEWLRALIENIDSDEPD